MNAGTPERKVAERWFSVSDVGDGVTLVTEPYAADFIRANFFLVDCGDEILVVDSGLGLASIHSEVAQCAQQTMLVLTHAHNDHRGGAAEFETRFSHPLEADVLGRDVHGRTRPQDWPSENMEAARSAGYQLPAYMLELDPQPGFDPDHYWIEAADPTQLVDEGDRIDAGSRQFTVLHLPGHTPGGIGLLEERTGVFFSGDLLYDGPLVDELPESNVDDFIRSVARIRDLPLSTVHGGHSDSLTRTRAVEVADAYLRSKGF